MNLPRSTYYYQSTKAAGLTDAELIAIIEDIQDELPCYGYLMAPRPARLPHPKPKAINPKDSRYERGTTGGQVRRPPLLRARRSS